MERDGDNMYPWRFNCNSTGQSTNTTDPSFDAFDPYSYLLQQFSQLSLPTANPNVPTPPPISNYSAGDSWMPSYLQRDIKTDLQRLRINSAVNGYYYPPATQDYFEPTLDQYADALLRRRGFLTDATPDTYLNHNLINRRYNYPIHDDYYDRRPHYQQNPGRSYNNYLYNNSGGSRGSTTRIRSRSNHHSYNNINGGTGMLSRNSSFNNDIQLPLPETLPSWSDLRGKIASLCVDPKSSSILQCMLAQGQMEGIEIAVSEVKEDITDIITHQVGLVFFKKLVDCCDDHQLSEILRALMLNNRNFLDICLHSQGTYGVQRLIRNVNKEDPSQRAVVMAAIVPIAVTLCKDGIASHVMIECLKAFEGINEVIAAIMEEIGNQCVEIAKDKSGCCVLQQCLAQPEGQCGRHRILSVIICNAYQLSEHEFGNYVVQYVIGMRNEVTNIKVVKNLKGSLASLSKSKYGSHVVEKLLKDLRDDKVRVIINELTFDPVLLDILQDSTGNYVAQTLLHRSRAMAAVSLHGKASHQQLINRINNHYAFLHSHPYGKNVLNHLKCKCKLDDYDFNVDFVSSSD